MIFTLPFVDVVIKETLGKYYCLTKKTSFVDKKIKNPRSIFWDNRVRNRVQKDFQAYDKKATRIQMVKMYLDGVFLKTIALNGSDDKIYVYACTKDDDLYAKYLKDEKFRIENAKSWREDIKNLDTKINSLIKKDKMRIYLPHEFSKLPKNKQDNLIMLGVKTPWDREYGYVLKTPEILRIIEKRDKLKSNLDPKKLYEKYFPNFIQKCIQSEKIYTKQTIPKTNYTIQSSEVPLGFFASKFFYAIESSAIDNQTNKVIAFNKKYIRYPYKMFLLDDGETVCGSDKGVTYGEKAFPNLHTKRSYIKYPVGKPLNYVFNHDTN